MKFIPRVVLFIFTIITSLCAKAQTMSIADMLDDGIIVKQADSLKNLFLQQGFEMIREATIAMKSQYEKPIILPLKEGTWYRVIFIGDRSSKLYEIRMYDWNEKQVVYEKQRSRDLTGNIINYDYIPRFSEFHMIKPVQINHKKKDVNGYMLLFKKII
jgi:hypothetical protein